MRVLNAYEDTDPWCRRMVVEFDGPRMKEILSAFQHNNDPRCECDFRVIHATAEKINLRVNIFMRSSCNYHLDLWEHYRQSHPLPNRRLFPVNVTVMK